MNSLTIWIIIIFSSLGTFLLRFSLIELYGKITLNPLLERSFPFIPPAVFAALVLPALFYNDNNSLFISLENSKLLAGIVAGFLAWKLKNVILTTVIGLGALWFFQWLF